MNNSRWSIGLLLFGISLCGCAAPQTMSRIETQTAIPIEPGRGASIAVSKVQFTNGGRVSTYNGLLKVFQGAQNYSSSEMNDKSADVALNLSEQLKTTGYRVVGSQSALFGQDTNDAEFLLGANATEYEVNRYAFLAGDYAEGNARVSFELYDPRLKRVVYRKGASGNAVLKGQNSNAGSEAIVVALSEVLADPVFVDIVTQNRPKQQVQIAEQAAPETTPNVVSDIDYPSFRSPERANDFAFIVGIEKYKELPSADYATRDADAVRRHFVALGYPTRNIIQLRDQEATRTGLQKYLEEWLPNNVSPDSRVFFYFSGHGVPDPKTGQAYLVPWDGDPQFLQSTAYPVKQLYASLNSLKAKEIVVALDSCFSGAGGRSILPKGMRPLVTKVNVGIPPSEKLVVFTATSADEITGSMENQGHGIFTYYFLKGLGGSATGPSGEVTVQSLYDYLKPKVADAARRQNRQQTPVLLGGEHNLMLYRPQQ